jgi:hypothetical protein
MLISLIFAINIASNFVINFTNNDDEYQNYFTLKGNLCGAELFRNGTTINLHFYNSTDSSHYHIYDESLIISFKWPYLLNSQEMRLVSGVNISGIQRFHTFVVADSQTDPEAIFQNSNIFETQNYYLIGALIAILLLIESPAVYYKYISSRQCHTAVTQLENSV